VSLANCFLLAVSKKKKQLIPSILLWVCIIVVSILFLLVSAAYLSVCLCQYALYLILITVDLYYIYIIVVGCFSLHVSEENHILLSDEIVFVLWIITLLQTEHIHRLHIP